MGTRQRTSKRLRERAPTGSRWCACSIIDTRKQSLTYNVPVQQVSDVAEGLNFLHTLSTPIIHGDIKGVSDMLYHVRLFITLFIRQLNILIKDNGDACISDFGLSKRSGEVTTTTLRDQGSLRWMARELLDSDYEGSSRSPKTVQSDCYSLGMLMLEVGQSFLTDRVIVHAG